MKPPIPALRRWIIMLSVAALGCAAVHAHATQITQPIRLVVPYPPGGATDLIGRTIGKALGDSLGVPVVVENKGGAAGSIGAAEVSHAKPDGQTLLLAALSSHAVYQALNPGTVQFDLAKSFDAVSMIGNVPQAFVVNPSVKANTLAEFLALARSRPGAVSIASAGSGSTQQMAAILLAESAGVNLLQVTYKGSGPAVTDLLAGHVDSMFGTLPSVQEHVNAGGARLLAVTSARRLDSAPAVPTFKEAGIENFDVNSLFGILAPTGTPPDRIDLIARAIERGLAQAPVREALVRHGVVIDYQGPAKARDTVVAEVGKWAGVVDRMKLRPQ